MSKVKHFQVKPEHVEAIRYGGRNGQDIVDWVNLFSERYSVKATIASSGSGKVPAILIEAIDGSTVWVVNNGDWVVRSFVNSYFYVESDSVMQDQYIKL